MISNISNWTQTLSSANGLNCTKRDCTSVESF